MTDITPIISGFAEERHGFNNLGEGVIGSAGESRWSSGYYGSSHTHSYRAVFGFDVADLPGGLESATFRFRLNEYSWDLSETLTLRAMSAATNASTPGGDVYVDAGDGSVYGAAVVPMISGRIVSITLNATAISDILEAAGGRFVFGVEMDRQPGDYDRIYMYNPVLSLTPNNTPPSLALANPVTTLGENTDVSTPVKVADIALTDDGNGTNAFRLAGADAGLFEIAGSELFIRAGAALDYETRASLSVTVEVDDPAFATNPDDSASLTVTLLDENDPPILGHGGIAGLDEGPATGSARSVTDITVNDDGFGAVTLSLAGADAALFQLDGATLSLRADAGLDHETGPTLEVIVQADDAAAPGAVDAELVLSVPVVDVNEAPTLSLAGLVTTLSESIDTSAPVRIADLGIADDALGTNVLSLGGTDAELFEIIGDGVFLKAGTLLDFETVPLLGFDVTLSDAGIGFSESLPLQITVLDANDAPVIDVDDASVSENVTQVTTVAASDVEGDPITFSLTGYGDGARFEIDPNSGVLSFVTPPDYEAPFGDDNVYDVEIRATDDRGGVSTQAITVAVEDVNEPATFDQAHIIMDLPENETFVLDTSLGLDDPDGAAFSYGLGSNSSPELQIDPVTGVLSFVAPQDFENPTDDVLIGVHRAEVIATDGDGLQAAQTVDVTITDLNDELPTLAFVPWQTQVLTSANVFRPTLLGYLEISDPDGFNALFDLAAGPHTDLFEFGTVDGRVGLYLKRGVDLSPYPEQNLDVTVTLDDLSNGAGVDTSIDVSLFVRDAAGVVFEARDDALRVGESEPLTGNLFNSNGLGSDIGAVTIAAVNGNPLLVAQPIVLASGAVVTVGPTGRFTYDQRNMLAGLDSGETADDTFTYTIAGRTLTAEGSYPARIDALNLLAEDGSRALWGETLTGIGAALAAGDINADGYDDLIVGASGADPAGLQQAGRVYVVFGGPEGAFGVDLDALDGTDGFIIPGIEAYGFLGETVASSDVNGDGIDDILIGANTVDGADQNLGATWVIYGSEGGGFGATFDLAALTTDRGFKIQGKDPGDYATNVAPAGDFNGDGLGDILISAPSADEDGAVDRGETYVVLGTFDAPAGELDLGVATPRFTFLGFKGGDQSGTSIAPAGDVNGDGYDDILVGAQQADPNFLDEAGAAYVVFGGPFRTDTTLDAYDIDGSNGFIIQGEEFDGAGVAVANIGDVNADGYDDLAVTLQDGSGVKVVWGRPVGFGPVFDLADIDRTGNGEDGLELFTNRVFDMFGGASIAGLGDVNGDGIDDFIIGAIGADLNDSPTYNSPDDGAAFVVFGTQNFAAGLDLGTLDGGNGFRIDGYQNTAIMGAAVASAGDHNGDGINDIIFGTPGGLAYHTQVLYGRASFDAVYDMAEVTITVEGRANDLPVAQDDQFTVVADVPLTGNVIGADGLGPDSHSSGAVLNVAAVNGNPLQVGETLTLASGATLTLAANGDLSYDPRTAFATLPNGQLAQDSFTYGLAAGTASAPDTPWPASLSLDAIPADVGQSYAAGSSSVNVAHLGDVNGDGIGDFAIANAAGRDSGTGLYKTAVVYGRLDGLDPGLVLTNLAPGDGFELWGSYPNDAVTVGSAGDINGDGLGDIVVLNPGRADPDGNPLDAAHVVFGNPLRDGAPILLGGLDGTEGFSITEAANFDFASGTSAHADLDGDGIDDLILGAPGVNGSSFYDTGAVYVVFGSNGGFATDLAATDLDGATGYEIRDNVGDISTGPLSFGSALAAGDLDGDGNVDLAVSDNEGVTVIFGAGTGLGGAVSVPALADGSTLRLTGVNDFQPPALTFADLNGDGIDDLVVGNPEADVGGVNSTGAVHVIYGTATGFAATIDLAGAPLNAAAGFTLAGGFASNLLGSRVVNAGDTNADGIEDLLIAGNGRSYVVYGVSGERASFAVPDMGLADGLELLADNRPEIAAGDVDGDGVSDLLLDTAVIYGRNPGLPVQDTARVAITVIGTADPIAPDLALDLTLVTVGTGLDTSVRVPLTQITITDPDGGPNALGLEGADVSPFEIVGDMLYLKAGTDLAALVGDTVVTVLVDDPTLAPYPDDAEDFTLRVEGNLAPIPQPDHFATSFDSLVHGNLFANNGSGPDIDPEAQPLSVVAVEDDPGAVGTAITLASGALLTVNANGNFTYDPNDAILPGAGDTVTDSFTYTVSDTALEASTDVRITIDRLTGSHGDVTVDTDGSKAWTSTFKVYDDTGGVSAMFVRFDNGKTWLMTYEDGVRNSAVLTDVDDAYGWRTKDLEYGTDGTVVMQQTTHDNGLVLRDTYTDGVLATSLRTDGGDNSTWTSIEENFDTTGVRTSRLTVYDDGSTTEQHYVDGVLRSETTIDGAGAYGWATTQTLYDETGARARTTTTFDDGRETTNVYESGRVVSILTDDLTDQFSWNRVEKHFDAEGRITLFDLTYDDGTTIAVDYLDGVRTRSLKTDVNDLHSYATIEYLFDAAGALASKLTTFDDGTTSAIDF